jgi:formiminotetrahydrofolate cyclodeaminase
LFQDRSLREFLDRLASRDSTPGGGSAAAVMGAMGAALVSMVCKLTVGKEGFEAQSAELERVLHEAEALRARLTDMILDDIEAFNGVMAAYGLPRNDDAQKAARAEAIQRALKAATDAPLACARACVEVIALSKTSGELGNKKVVSDAGVAALAAYAALKSAALNVYINIGAIKDERFAAERRTEIESLIAAAETETEAIYALVKSRL